MADASIPVDLFNPGQVFACLGFLEAAEVLLGEAKGGFNWSDDANARFILRANGEESPIETVLRFLAKAKVKSIAPGASELSTEKWDVPTRRLSADAPFPFPLPSSPATLPAVLEVEEATTPTEVVINHWGDDAQQTGRDNAKFWAGSGGYPGAALARDALDLVRDRCCDAVKAPFELSVEQSSSFRFDWRRDYIPLDIGFSLNNHPKDSFSTVGYPLVEVLAAIGLTNARPLRGRTKLEYRYGVIGVLSVHQLLHPCLLRAALGCSKTLFPQRVFRMYLGWPGKENQARSITTVVEESNYDCD
jgi:CRISPR-associated protein Csx14